MKEKKPNLKSMHEKFNDASKNVGVAAEMAGNAALQWGNSAKNAGNEAIQKLKDFDLRSMQTNPGYIIQQITRIPYVRIDRVEFLRKELIKYYPERIVNLAIAKNPAYAGIEQDKINGIAKQVINFETNKVSAISFAAGMPGGFAMAVTVPADITQYFCSIIRVMQKLAYLYGFEEFEFNESEVSDDTLNQVMIFLGVMYGVQGANAGVKLIAQTVSQKIAKTLANKALTKGAIYPIVKKISLTVGFSMTKPLFATGVSRTVPVIGGVVTGGLTYATFKPLSYNLQKSFKKLKLSDPKFYKEQNGIIDV